LTLGSGAVYDHLDIYDLLRKQVKFVDMKNLKTQIKNEISMVPAKESGELRNIG
jgi:FAD synthase